MDNHNLPFPKYLIELVPKLPLGNLLLQAPLCVRRQGQSLRFHVPKREIGNGRNMGFSQVPNTLQPKPGTLTRVGLAFPRQHRAGQITQENMESVLLVALQTGQGFHPV